MAAIALRPDSVRANPDPLSADSNRDAVRAAPRVPSGRRSLASEAAKRPPILRRLLSAIEPWYDWGTINTWRLDARTLEEADASEFMIPKFELQWLGMALELRFGRMPRKGR